MKRMSYLNLNGEWKYAIRATDKKPKMFDGTILVPYAPESKLSGVNHQLLPEERLWYERELIIPDGFYMGGKLLLHFGAVDQICEIFINDISVKKHEGGYTAFEIDITPYLKEENYITVCVRDYTDTSYYGRGKQTLHPKGIWYGSQSGIWQTVWLENVPSTYIQKIWITPKYDKSCVEILVEASQDLPCRLAYNSGEKEGIAVEGIANHAFEFYLEEVHPWSPEDPFLYDVIITMGADRVATYFGMRKFSIEEVNGVKRLCLNNKPYIHKGILDQGYYPEGGYTPKEESVYAKDIQTVKEMGFNTIRKHCKIEPLLWYHYCDKNGILVWQDFVNGGEKYKKWATVHPLFTNFHAKDSRYAHFARRNEAGRKQYLEEIKETLHQLYNCVSIAMWVPFNEGWGQFDSVDIRNRILDFDDTRHIDPASGWSDQHVGDISSKHVYFKKYRFKKDRQKRAVILSEFGGFSLPIEGHIAAFKEFGYKKLGTQKELEEAYIACMEKEIKPAVKKGLSAFIYTQLTDVEGEVNGLLTNDRSVEKISRAVLQALHNEIQIDEEEIDSR
jgi:beta-galactosidase/beta-glucuronidase